MKKYRIAVQQGLNEIAELLKDNGHDVVEFETSKDDIDITIISGVDSAYEEIETAQCRVCGPDDTMLVINATTLSPEKVLEYVENIKCS
ncbi:YkuS family protein [Wukongibacter baidiensis]|uniref:YkuS family protein n=1 Tax=Wukongibacter baidiensis TaxID=1723361 RepID=UPI003D7F7A72